jgi:TorA maturation chaperone TorD
VSNVALPPEEQYRADVYGLLASLLLAPEAHLVDALACMPSSEDESATGRAWDQLLAAARSGPAAVRDEYDALFIAAGTPRLNPYQCYYLAGWLMDKPLSALRHDLRQLGLERLDGATELEDHIGALCEAMRVLIEKGTPEPAQHDFFERHLAGWSATCLDDIANAPGAVFYRALALFAQAFLELESQHVPTTA